MTDRTNGSEAPTQAGALSLLETLEEGEDHKTECHWPGKPELKFWMTTLHVDDTQVSYAAAAKRWEKLELKLDLYNSDNFHDEVTIQMLARSIRNLKDPTRREFPDVDKLRKILQPDIRTMLATDYMENQADGNPKPKDLHPNMIELIRLEVKKKDVPTLAVYGSLTLALYLIGTENPQDG